MLSATPGTGRGGNEVIGEAGSSPDLLNHHHHLQQQQQQQQQEGARVSIPFQEILGSITTTTPAAEDNSSEDPNKKIRKPYTITKSRESWTEQEHDKFLEALQLFDRDWKKIEAFVGSKTVIQIRSHAQKYFLKVQKNGTSEHVPPPRPKRKAAHPYPQKASKNGYSLKFDSSSVIRNSTCGTISSWDPGFVQPVDVSHTRKDDAGPSVMLLNNSCSSSSAENPARTSQNCETTELGHHVTSVRAMPDFARVYGFIGNIFDANKSGHLQKLKEMDPIDVETVLLLMKNLSLNLKNPDFEGHRKLLSLYDDCVEGKSGGPKGMLESVETMNVPFLLKGEQ